jgi:hypothetical protein
VISDSDISEFIALVDTAYGLPLEGDAALAPEESLGAERRIRNEPYEEVWRLIGRSPITKGPNLRQLEGALIKRAVLDEQLGRPRDVVHALRIGLSTDRRICLPFTERETWLAALQIIRSTLQPESASYVGLERELAVAHAVKRLRDGGYLIDPADDGFKYRPGELERACRDLNGMIAQVGGPLLAKCLLSTLRLVNGRYLIARPSRGVPLTMNTNPSIPYGYLLNLAMRNMGGACTVGTPAERLSAIVSLATDIVASQDIEHYSIHAAWQQNHETLPAFLSDLMSGDHLLMFRQICPTDALTMLEGLFTWVDERKVFEKLGWSVNDAVLLAKVALNGVSPSAINAVITKGRLSSSGIAKERLDAMMAYFADPCAEVNREYLLPSDAKQATSRNKPFIRLADGTFMMIYPSIAANTFVGAISDALRLVYRAKDFVATSVGTAAEGMLSAAFTRHGIIPTVTSGKYLDGKEERECDLVLEFEEAVVLIEIKKKSVTNDTYSGYPLAGFIDLGESALSAQMQLGRHELHLRTYGKIEFLDGQVLTWGGRKIERVAVSLYDWGGIQDQAVLRTFIAYLAGAKLEALAATPAMIKRLDETNKTLQALEQQIRHNADSESPIWAQLGNLWFVSIPQLLYLLNEVDGPADFYKTFLMSHAMHIGTLDFYSQLVSWKRMLAAKAPHDAGP